MEPTIIITLISLLANAMGWFISRAFYRSKYKAELDELKARTDNIEASTSLSTVQAADIVAKSASVMLQPLLDRIGELQREILLIKQEKEQLALEVATQGTQLAILTQENLILKTGLQQHARMES